MIYTGLILFINTFFFMIFFSCSKDNDRAKGELYYPYIFLSKNANTDLVSDLNEIVLEGKYIKCKGRKSGEIWKVSSINANNQKIKNRLSFKGGDRSCELNFTKLSLKSRKNVIYTHDADETKDTLLKDSYFGYILELKSNDNVIHSNIRLLNGGAKIEIIFLELDLKQEVNQFSENISVKLDAEPDDGLNKIQVNLGESKLKRYKFINNGNTEISIKDFSSDYVFNNTCSNSTIQPQQVCYADFLLTARSISENKFKVTANFKFNHDLAKIKSINKDVSISSVINNEINSLKWKYIYRIFHFNSTIFALYYDDHNKALYYSNNGPNGDFKIATGIPAGVEIRGMARSGNNLYAIAFNNSDNYILGGLYVSKMINNEYHFELVKEMSHIKDYYGISSNGNLIYVATKENGLYYFEDGKHDQIRGVTKFINKNTNKKTNEKRFNDVFVFDNMIFAIKDKNIFYSNGLNKDEFEVINTKLMDIDEITYIKSIAILNDKIFLGTNNGLFISGENAKNKSNILNLLKSDFLLYNYTENNAKVNFRKNDIYDLKTYGNSIYIAAICFVGECGRKSGIYYINLSTSKDFKQIFVDKNLKEKNYYGITINGGSIYATTANGFRYLDNYFPKKISVDGYVNNRFSHFYFSGDIFNLFNGNEYFYSNGLGKNNFQKLNMNLSSHEILSIHGYGDYVYAILNNSKNQDVWYAKKENNALNFRILRTFSNLKITSVFATRERLYISSENYLISMDMDNFENNMKINYLNISRNSQYQYNDNEIILDIKENNHFIYLLTNKGLYSAFIKDKNGNVLDKDIEFIKSKSNFPSSPSSIFIENNKIYLSTPQGLWFSNSGIDGYFQKVNAFGNEVIFSVGGVGSSLFVFKSDGISSIHIYDYSENFLNFDLNKLNNNIVVNSVLAINKNIVAAVNDGVMLSKDSGNSFNRILLGDTSSRCNNLFSFEDKIYAATDNGVYVAENSLDNFKKITGEMTSYKQITAHKGKLFIAAESGIFEYDNELLKKLNSFKAKKIYSDGNRIFSISLDGKLYKSDDGIQFDSIYNDVLKNKIVTSIFFHNSKLYIGTKNGLFVFFEESNFSKQIFIHSSDLRGNEINSILKMGSILYVGTNNGLAVSVDGGESFSIKSRQDGMGHEKVNDIYIQLSNTPNFSLSTYVATDNGVSISNL